MNNTPQAKTFTVEFTVTLTATGDDSFNHVPTKMFWSLPFCRDLFKVDETEQTFTAFENEVVAQWSACYETTLPVGEVMEMIRVHGSLDWSGNGCHGDHFESTGVDISLNLDSIA